MSIEQGTPRFGQKIAVALGLGHAIGLTDAEIATVQTGDKADWTKGEQMMLALLQPAMNAAEADVQGDLVTMIQGLLALIPSVSSVGGFVKAIESVLAAEAGPLEKQAQALGQTTMTTIASAALAAAGKTNLPAS